MVLLNLPGNFDMLHLTLYENRLYLPIFIFFLRGFVDYAEKFQNINQHPKLPKHIGIIMDGNGRWAARQGLPRAAGHNEGVNSVQDVVEACGELQIEVLTIYTFSEENWKRPGWEVASLMQLLVTTINKQIDRLIKQNVRIRTIGSIDKLPSLARNAMRAAVSRTKHNTGLVLNVALSYGGRQEITGAVRKLAEQVKSGILEPDQIDEEMLAANLDTGGQPYPDLIIRTGGESRISNFLIWQAAYSEIFITDTAWPEFRKENLIDAVWDFIHRERRFGRVSSQIQSEAVLSSLHPN